MQHGTFNGIQFTFMDRSWLAISWDVPKQGDGTSSHLEVNPALSFDVVDISWDSLQSEYFSTISLEAGSSNLVWNTYKYHAKISTGNFQLFL